MMSGTSPARAGLFLLLLAFASALSLPSCAVHRLDGEISIVSYNAMALFDATDDGLEYSGYRVGRGEWSEELFRDRIANLKTALALCAKDGPDIACLVEIENAKCLSDLRGAMPKSGYAYSGFAGGDTSTGCGVLSRLPIVELKSHRPAIGSGTAPFRPILEARIAAGATPIFIFVNHWKSKSEGEEATEDLRIASAALLARLIADRTASFPDAICIACGDMNEEADAWENSPNPRTTALGTFIAATGSCTPPEGCPILLIDRPRDDSAFPEYTLPGGRGGKSALVLVSPWLFPENASGWSYWWKDGGEKIDHFFLPSSLFDGQGWEFEDFRVLKPDELLDGSGHPEPWTTSSRKGFSDHLPIRLLLRKIG